MDRKTEIIDKYHNGDEAAYEEEMTYESCSAIEWKDIQRKSRCVPEQQFHALAWIESVLGYIPEPNIFMPYISFVQVLVDNVEKNIISPADFMSEMVFHAKAMRNDDMIKGEWVRYKTYDQSHHTQYNDFLSIYKLPARDRLSKLLGYEPALEHSLEAELFLRRLFQRDDFHSDMPYGHTDLKAAAIVRYREAFLLEGKSVADDSDLVGMIYNDKSSP